MGTGINRTGRGTREIGKTGWGMGFGQILGWPLQDHLINLVSSVCILQYRFQSRLITVNYNYFHITFTISSVSWSQTYLFTISCQGVQNG